MAKQQSAAAAQQSMDLLIGAWRQGYKQPSRVGFDEYKKANTFRLRLYIAVRKYRKDGSLDPELTRMLEGLEAVIEEAQGKYFVVIRKVEENLELARIAKELGLPWGEEALAMESLKRIQESLENYIPEPEPVSYLEAKASNSAPTEDEELQRLRSGPRADLYGDD